MDVATRRGAAEREDLLVLRADIAHLGLGNLAVVQRCAPVGGALKYRQVPDGLGEFLDCLHRGCTSADDPDALAGKVHTLSGPGMGVARQALEGVDTWDVRHRSRRQDSDSADQKACRVAAAVFQREFPAAVVLAVMRGRDAAVELDVAP